MDPITEHCLLTATSVGLFFFMVREFFLYLDGSRRCKWCKR